MQHVDEGRLHAWLDGELPPAGPEGARALERHLDECAACRALAEEERRIRDGASAILRGADPGEIAPPRVIPLPVRGGRRAQPWITLGWAASVLLALGIGWVARPSGDDQIAIAPSVPAPRAPAPVAPRNEPPLVGSGASAPTPATPLPARSSASTASAPAPQSADLAPLPRGAADEAPAPDAAISPPPEEAMPTLPPPPPPAAVMAPPPVSPPVPGARAERVVGRAAGASVAASSDNVTVRGVVTDPAGRALAGATVSVPALNVRTVTRADGSYVLSLPTERIAGRESVQVVAARVGSTTQAQSIEPASVPSLDFSLPAHALALEGVVVTATGSEPASGVRAPVWSDAERAEAERHLGRPPFLVPELPLVGISIGEVGRRPAVRVVQSLPGGGELTLVQRGAPRARACAQRAGATSEGARLTIHRDGLVIEATAPTSPESLHALLCAPGD